MYPLSFKFKRRLRPFAAITLLLFTWVTIEPWNFAAAQAPPQLPPPPSNVPKKSTTAPEKFEESLRAAKQLLEKLDQEIAEGKDSTATFETLKGHRQSLEAADTEIRAEFAATEAKLKGANLPAEILERHRKAVADYEADFQKLQENLQTIEQLEQGRKEAQGKKDQAGARAKEDQIKQRVKEVQTHLKEKIKEPRHTPLDPNNLPHRTPKIQERKPRLKKEEFPEPTRSGFLLRPKPILIASIGPLTGLLAAPGDLPTTADLAETLEVQFTPEIKALAAQLERNPLKIYNFVRSSIDFVPTYGSLQGAQMCLLTKQCNDMDTASLLIALLRTSGIPARYIVGTIEVPIEQIMNWVGGFTDARAALNFIASGGTPVTGVISGGTLVAARMEHVWVEAFVDYVPSRGAVHKEGDTWVPLDASFKQHTFIAPLDLTSVLPTDFPSLFSQLQNSATVGSGGDSLTMVDQTLLRTEMDRARTAFLALSGSRPGLTVAEVIGGKAIVKNSLPLLPVALPYSVVVAATPTAAIPDTLRHHIRFEITDELGLFTQLSYQASTVFLANKRVTLSYHPATTARDVALVGSFGGILNVPPYLLRVRPLLKIEGANVAFGNADVGMGSRQSFRMTLISPNVGTDVVSNEITAGNYSAIVVNTGFIATDSLEKRKAALESVKSKLGLETIIADNFLGETLFVTGLTYWSDLEMIKGILANQAGVARTSLLSEGIVSQLLNVATLFGVPIRVSDGGLNIDVDRDVAVVIAKDGNSEKAKRFVFQAGYIASGMENSVFEQLYQAPSVSAVRLLAEANNSGIPIFKVTQSNIAGLLPQLQVSAAVKADILNSVSAGKEVMIPQHDLTFNSWSGIGYVVLDPTTGAAGYIIAGGRAGGSTTVPTWLDNLQNFLSYVVGVLDDAIQALATVPQVGLNSPTLARWAAGLGNLAIAAVVIIDVYKAYQNGVTGGNLILFALASAVINVLVDFLLFTLFSALLATFVTPFALIVGVILAIAIVFLAIKLLALIESLLALWEPMRRTFYAAVFPVLGDHWLPGPLAFPMSARGTS